MTDKTIDDGLTEEERAALAEEEGADPAEDHAADETAGAEDETKASTADETKSATEQAAGEEKSSEPSGDEETAAPASQPILVAPPPEDTAAKLAEIEGKKEALLTQFDDGEITAKEYQKQLDTLSKEERAIERAQDRAELAAAMEQQRLQNDWTATCNAFVDLHPVYKDNPRLYKALDAEVRDLAAKPETANWPGQKFLDEAHKALKQAFGFQEAVGTGKPRPARELPPNLSKVPAAEVEDTSGGRFAVLDRMASSDPVGYEEALSKMSDADRNAYLAST